MKNIDCKESTTAKGANIATEFNELKDTSTKQHYCVLTYKNRFSQMIINKKKFKKILIIIKILTDDRKQK